MEHWHVFDAHCTVGRHLKLQPGGPHTVEDLLGEMDHHGVAEALVVDSFSREVHPADGNRRVLEVCADQPRLHPAWALLPTGTNDEQPGPEQLVEQMCAAKAGAAWLFTGQYHFGLEAWCVDDLLAPLADAKVPVFVHPNDTGTSAGATDLSDLDGLVQLCRRFPTLPVILTEHRIRRSHRHLLRALEAVPNLHVELSSCWLHHAVEYLSQRFGPERLLYGSNWPNFGHGLNLAPLTCADIDDDAKRLIAGDNLRRLTSWCEPDQVAWEPPPAPDPYVRFARTGERPKDLRFADCHGHLGRFNHYYVPTGSIDDAAAEMDRLGVDCCCVFSFSGVVGDEQPGNDLVAEAQRLHPSRFVGFTMVNPHRGEAEMLRELERGAALGLRGVKLIPHYQGYPPEGPNIDVACRWADEHHQLILDHHWGSPQQVERLVSSYPNACFLTGHTTTAYADVMRRYPNLYVCSCPLLAPGECERVVEAIGADRFLFGSDLLDLPIAWGLGPILFARMAPEEKALVLGGNLRKLLGEYSLEA